MSSLIVSVFYFAEALGSTCFQLYRLPVQLIIPGLHDDLPLTRRVVSSNTRKYLPSDLHPAINCSTLSHIPILMSPCQRQTIFFCITFSWFQAQYVIVCLVRKRYPV